MSWTLGFYALNIINNIKYITSNIINTEIERPKYDEIKNALIIIYEDTYNIINTDKKDDKDMWEGYNKNLGYCIGINTEKLKQYSKTTKFQEELDKNARSSYMMNVVYEEDKQIQVIKSIIEDEYNKFLKNYNKEICKYIDPLTFSYNFKIIDLWKY